MTFTEFVKRCAIGANSYYWQVIRPHYGFKRRIEIIFRDVTTGIDNLLQWFPVIWKDRYWDSHYLFIIMKKKLENMEKGIREADIHTDAAEDADEILICINCLDRLIKDEYQEIAFKDHEEKWGNLIWDSKKDERRSVYHLNIYREKVLTPEEKEQEIEESKRCWEFAETMKHNDLETLFEIMKKESLCWWD